MTSWFTGSGAAAVSACDELLFFCFFFDYLLELAFCVFFVDAGACAGADVGALEELLEREGGDCGTICTGSALFYLWFSLLTF